MKKNFNKKRTDQAGFSLVEVLVALSILTLGLLGIAMMQYTAIVGNTFSREMSLATEIGQNFLETTNQMIYANADLSVGAHGPVVMAPEPNNPNLSFTRTWNVVAGAGNQAVTNAKTITVTVNWIDKNGTPHNVVLSTVKWDSTASPY